MSEIYLAHQQGLGGFKKLVVLKTILPDIGGEEDFVRMFLEEARTTAAFNHPNIAQVYELDVEAGLLFMAMEFIQGCTLVELARACRQAKEPIPMGLTLAAVRDTALALHYAHTFTDARGRRQIVIHRDVAEKNVMVTYDGVTKLLDFGIAKAIGRTAAGRTNIGMVKGTSGYMSPEQIRGEPLDPRSDIFSLGVVLHECLTGMRLFFGKNPEEGMLAALRESVQPPSAQNRLVPPDVDAVVLKALSRNRDDRYVTALEMARAIERAAAGLIWHPEQCAETVSRFFSDRRDETRRLLEAAAYGAESTGEITLGSVLAKVKATSPSSDQYPRAVVPKEASPVVPPPRPKRPSVPSGAPVLPPEPTTSPSSAGPGGLTPSAGSPGAAPNPVPVRGKVVSGSKPPVVAPPPTPPIPPPKPLPIEPIALPRPPSLQDYDDESDAKTIPAAALPDEIRALRKRLQAQAAARGAHASMPEAATPAAGPPALQAAPITSPHGTPAASDVSDLNHTPAAGVPPHRTGGTEPHAAHVPQPQPTSVSSETLSITGRGVPPWNPEDEVTDERGIKTKIERPPVVGKGQPSATLSSEDLKRTAERDPSRPTTGAHDADVTDEIRRDVRRRRAALIIAITVLVALFVVAVLWLLSGTSTSPSDSQQRAPKKTRTESPARK